MIPGVIVAVANVVARAWFAAAMNSSVSGTAPEKQTWDIALTSYFDDLNFPPYLFYSDLVIDGYMDWVSEEPELRQLHEQVLGTVDREKQQTLIRQMERHTRDQAYFLFVYNPIKLYAVNKAVDFVPYMTTDLILVETAVTGQHGSLRRQKATMHK